MSRYRESNLTDQGLDLARKAANGVIKITFTKGVLSADAHQNDSLQTIEGLTTLNAFTQSDPINYVTPSDDANVNVPLRFHNTNMTADAYINTVGLYATDGTNEVLYSVIINDDPELFPAYNGTTPESIKINHTTQVGRADQVSVQVNPMGSVTEEEFQQLLTNLDGFKIREITNDDDFWGLGPGIYICQGENPKHNPYDAQLWGTAISYGKTIQFFNKDGNAWIITPDNGGWEKLAKEGYVDNAISNFANSINSINNALGNFSVREMTDNDDFWGLAPGIYTSDGQNPKHNPYNAPLWGVAISYGKTIQYFNKDGVPWIITPNNGGWARNDGFPVREITDDDDFWALKPGIYICQGENPKNNPYNDKIWGTAVSFGKTIQFFNKDGEEWIITPDNGGWEKFAKHGYVDSAVNSVADNLNSQVSGFNSVIAVNQSSAIANASNAWAQIRYNGSDISNLKSQTASNATRAYNIEGRTSAAENDISNVKSQTASNATRIFNAENRLNANDTKIGQLSQYRTTYSGNILNMYSLADGLYWLTGDNYNGPVDKIWGNALVSHINPYDTMIVVITGTTVYMNMTSNNSWVGWNQFLGQSDLNNLQSQINAIKSKLGM